MNEQKRKGLAGDSCGIEVFHRGIKQCCEIEKAKKGEISFQPHIPFDKGIPQA